MRGILKNEEIYVLNQKKLLIFAAYTNNHRHQNIMNRLLRRLPRLGYRQKIVLLLFGWNFCRVRRTFPVSAQISHLFGE